MAGRRHRLHEKSIAGILRLAPLVFAATCAALAGGERAFADDANTRPIGDAIELGPSRCLEKKAIADQISMWLGHGDIDARLAIVIEDAPDGVRFVVRRDDRKLGERTLNVVHVPCQEIHAAVGLGVASAIDATILTSLGVTPPAAPPPKPTPPPTAPVPVPTPPSPPPPPVWVPPPGLSPGFGPPKPEPPKSPYPEFTFTLAGMVLIDVLPEVTVGVAPSAELSVVKGFDLRASALATGVVTVELSEGVGTADVGLVAGRLDACAVLVLKNDIARLRGCGGLVAGGVNANPARGVFDPKSAVGPWIAPSLHADARWNIVRHFSLMFGVDGFFPGLKPDIETLAPDGTVAHHKEFPLAGVGLSLAPAVSF